LLTIERTLSLRSIILEILRALALGQILRIDCEAGRVFTNLAGPVALPELGDSPSARRALRPGT